MVNLVPFGSKHNVTLDVSFANLFIQVNFTIYF
jgi:hypothetical protein